MDSLLPYLFVRVKLYFLGILFALRLTLYDGDADHTITSSSVKFEHYSQSDHILLNESLIPDLSFNSTRNSVLIEGEASAGDYSRLLRTLRYNLIRIEPDLFVQKIRIDVQSKLSNVSCIFTIFIVEDNDNVPTLVLNGQKVSFI